MISPELAGEGGSGASARPSTNMRSLSRALEIFELLQRSERPQRLSDLARLSSMSLPTTLRMLRVLQEFHLVSQSGKTYRIGPAVLPAARSFLEHDPLVDLSRPILQQLASEVGLTASLYSRLGVDRILIARVEGKDPIRYELPLGRRLSLTAGAAGKVLLADASEEDLAHVVAASILLEREPASFDLDQLKARLPPAGEKVAFSAGERMTGVVSIAVAVPHPSGPPLQSLALSASMETRSEADMRAMGPELARAAQSLSERLVTTVY